MLLLYGALLLQSHLMLASCKLKKESKSKNKVQVKMQAKFQAKALPEKSRLR